MTISASTVVSLAALMAAIFTLVKYYNNFYDFIQKQKKQDEEIKDIKDELCVISYGLLACLDGLKQLGANGNVTDAHEKLEKHLNQSAHK